MTDLTIPPNRDQGQAGIEVKFARLRAENERLQEALAQIAKWPEHAPVEVIGLDLATWMQAVAAVAAAASPGEQR